MLIKNLKYWLTLAVYLYLTTHSNWSTKKKKLNEFQKKRFFPFLTEKLHTFQKRK